MKKTVFLLIVGALFLGNSSHLPAQILNGSFTQGSDGFQDWTLVGGSSGGPQVVTTNPASPSTSPQALIQSTDGDLTLSISASAATIEAAFNAADTVDTSYSTLTLPSTVGDMSSGYPGTWSPVNGQAIYQTFTLGAEATLSFAYSFQSFDSLPFDSTGYVLDGVYTQLASPTEYYYQTPNPNPTSYTTIPLTLSAGTHTLGFVAYNTGGHGYSSSLYVTDVSVPEPSEWALMVLGCVGLLVARRTGLPFRRSARNCSR